MAFIYGYFDEDGNQLGQFETDLLVRPTATIYEYDFEEPGGAVVSTITSELQIRLIGTTVPGEEPDPPDPPDPPAGFLDEWIMPDFPVPTGPTPFMDRGETSLNTLQDELYFVDHASRGVGANATKERLEFGLVGNFGDAHAWDWPATIGRVLPHADPGCLGPPEGTHLAANRDDLFFVCGGGNESDVSVARGHFHFSSSPTGYSAAYLFAPVIIDGPFRMRFHMSAERFGRGWFSIDLQDWTSGAAARGPNIVPFEDFTVDLSGATPNGVQCRLGNDASGSSFIIREWGATAKQVNGSPAPHFPSYTPIIRDRWIATGSPHPYITARRRELWEMELDNDGVLSVRIIFPPDAGLGETEEQIHELRSLQLIQSPFKERIVAVSSHEYNSRKSTGQQSDSPDANVTMAVLDGIDPARTPQARPGTGIPVDPPASPDEDVRHIERYTDGISTFLWNGASWDETFPTTPAHWPDASSWDFSSWHILGGRNTTPASSYGAKLEPLTFLRPVPFAGAGTTHPHLFHIGYNGDPMVMTFESPMPRDGWITWLQYAGANGADTTYQLDGTGPFTAIDIAQCDDAIRNDKINHVIPVAIWAPAGTTSVTVNVGTNGPYGPKGYNFGTFIPSF